MTKENTEQGQKDRAFLYGWWCRQPTDVDWPDDSFYMRLKKVLQKPFETDAVYAALKQELYVPKPKTDDSNWLTQAKVVRGLGKYMKGSNAGQQEVSRLCAKGLLRTNGKNGKRCRIDPASVLEYCQRNGISWNET